MGHLSERDAERPYDDGPDAPDEIAFRPHVLFTNATCRCNKWSDWPCPICDGGLAVCSVCGKAEAELDSPCYPAVV